MTNGQRALRNIKAIKISRPLKLLVGGLPEEGEDVQIAYSFTPTKEEQKQLDIISKGLACPAVGFVLDIGVLGRN